MESEKEKTKLIIRVLILLLQRAVYQLDDDRYKFTIKEFNLLWRLVEEQIEENTSNVQKSKKNSENKKV